ncbi:MAG: hypothetical protein ACOZFS_00285 [Thermodesulfobacteriota bacterium]
MTKFSAKKQLKGKPRGRPFPPGVSGNPRGRPKGRLNKSSLSVLEGVEKALAKIKRAEEERAKPLILDKTRHFEAWSDCYIQDGMRFRKDNLERVNPNGDIPLRPKRLNIRENRQAVLWGGRRYWSQYGWLFDPSTWKAVNPD